MAPLGHPALDKVVGASDGVLEKLAMAAGGSAGGRSTRVRGAKISPTQEPDGVAGHLFDQRRDRPREAAVRSVGILGVVLALSAAPADAIDANRSCLDLLEEDDGAKLSPAQDEQPLLTDNQCEAMKSRELRALLLEVPQEEEDPIQLSLGIKNGGGALRLKIPFSSF